MVLHGEKHGTDSGGVLTVANGHKCSYEMPWQMIMFEPVVQKGIAC